MLWPFSRRKMILYKSHPEHLPVIIGDVQARESDFQGYVQVVSDERSYTVLVHQGKPVQHIIVHDSGVKNPNPGLTCGHILSCMSEESTILVMELDTMLAACLATMFSHTPDLSVTPGSASFKTTYEQSCATSDLLVVNVVQDNISMPAIIEQGEVVAWFKYQEKDKTFSMERNKDNLLSFCATNAKSVCFDFYRNLEPVEQNLDFSGDNDPFTATAASYRMLFEQINAIMTREKPQKTAEGLRKLLTEMRKKYPPLYQGLFINPETMEVNWTRLIENRIKISHKYRYDLYFIYLDELLLLLIRMLYALMGVQGVLEVIRFVEQRRKADQDTPYRMVQAYYTKLNNLLHMDRLGSSSKTPTRG